MDNQIAAASRIAMRTAIRSTLNHSELMSAFNILNKITLHNFFTKPAIIVIHDDIINTSIGSTFMSFMMTYITMMEANGVGYLVKDVVTNSVTMQSKTPLLSREYKRLTEPHYIKDKYVQYMFLIRLDIVNAAKALTISKEENE